LFAEGKQLRSFPFTIYVHPVEFSSQVPFQVVISVPKRIWKRAHDRNYIKRLMREAIRRNKSNLEVHLAEQNLHINMCLVYTHAENLSYLEIEKSIVKGFEKIVKLDELKK
jgi:ribonuclease P protein component